MTGKELRREPWYRYFPDPNPPPPGPGEKPRYVASEAIIRAVNTALIVGQPLLVMGEPGVGKSSLARSIAQELGLGDVLLYVTRSDSQPTDVLYRFDHLARLYDAQRSAAESPHPEHYVRLEALGVALESDSPRVVLIDEVDKASRDFSDGLLHELDQLSFRVRETGRVVPRPAPERSPFVLITSNEERDLSDAFLRRCVFLRIPFPDDQTLARILAQHLQKPPDDPLVGSTVDRFKQARTALQGGIKKPSLGELVSWGRMLQAVGADPKVIVQAPWRELHPELLAKCSSDHELLVERAAR